jgi:hypothetical protein
MKKLFSTAIALAIAVVSPVTAFAGIEINGNVDLGGNADARQKEMSPTQVTSIYATCESQLAVQAQFCRVECPVGKDGGCSLESCAE